MDQRLQAHGRTEVNYEGDWNQWKAQDATAPRIVLTELESEGIETEPVQLGRPGDIAPVKAVSPVMKTKLLSFW